MDAVPAPADVAARAKIGALAQAAEAPLAGMRVPGFLLDQSDSIRAKSCETDVPRLAASTRASRRSSSGRDRVMF